MALPAHRRHELHHLASLSGSRGIIVPDVVKDFDHQELALSLREELPDLEQVLVLGGSPRDGSLSLDAVVAEGQSSRDEVDGWDPDSTLR